MRSPKDPAWRCAYCLRQRPYVVRINRRAPCCLGCRDTLAERGLKWCGGCAAPRSAAAFAPQKGRCRACIAAQQRAAGHADSKRYRQRHYARYLANKRAHDARKRAALGAEWGRQKYRMDRARRARRLLGLLRGGT